MAKAAKRKKTPAKKVRKSRAQNFLSRVRSLSAKGRKTVADLGYGNIGYALTRALYNEYKALSPEEQKEVKQGLLKLGIKLLTLI